MLLLLLLLLLVASHIAFYRLVSPRVAQIIQTSCHTAAAKRKRVTSAMLPRRRKAAAFTAFAACFLEHSAGFAPATAQLTHAQHAQLVQHRHGSHRLSMKGEQIDPWQQALRDAQGTNTGGLLGLEGTYSILHAYCTLIDTLQAFS